MEDHVGLPTQRAPPPRPATVLALVWLGAAVLLAPPVGVSAQEPNDATAPTTVDSGVTVETDAPDISLLEGGVVQVRPGYVPGGSTAPPMGPVLGPSPTLEPNEWSSVGLAVILTVTPLLTVAALFWLSRKPLPAPSKH
ncbi:MAG: hypothetical protein O3C27_12970 [Actinomycetota bacterium]|nr:hypothetical protein [Actinomycetota bacterium]